MNGSLTGSLIPPMPSFRLFLECPVRKSLFSNWMLEWYRLRAWLIEKRKTFLGEPLDKHSLLGRKELYCTYVIWVVTSSWPLYYYNLIFYDFLKVLRFITVSVWSCFSMCCLWYDVANKHRLSLAIYKFDLPPPIVLVFHLEVFVCFRRTNTGIVNEAPLFCIP